MGDSMRYKTLYDGQEKHTVASFDTKEQAQAFIQKAELAATALYPTLSADVGMLTHSPIWGSAPTPQALRAASYYLGVSAGWPMREITVEREDGKIVPLSLAHSSSERISQKLTICKQLFENIAVMTGSVSHEAVKISAPFSFVLIECDEIDAVDLKRAEGLRSIDSNILGLPICFASLSDDALKLRACQSGRGTVFADDVMHMLALAYLYRIGRAEAGRPYFAAGGEYRVEGSFSVSLRSLCVEGVPI